MEKKIFLNRKKITPAPALSEPDLLCAERHESVDDELFLDGSRSIIPAVSDSR